MVISCNPDPDHKLCSMISWWLDSDGYPIQERDGIKRWFVLKGGDYIWGDSPEELHEKLDTPTYTCKPISFSFISATIQDNPPMLENNQDYLAWLEGLNDVDKARLLHGNWYARPETSSYFKESWLKSADKVPHNAVCVRAWDKAATEYDPKTSNFADFTASIKMYKTLDGDFYISGEFHPDNQESEDIKGRFRKRAGERDRIIEKQAAYDGKECTVILPVDPGSHGKVEYQESAKKLINKGFRVKRDPVATNKSKLTKFMPFASACENGMVYIVRDTFPDKRTLDEFIKELSGFDGERSTRKKHDDWTDSVSSAFNALCAEETIPTFTLPELTRNNPFKI